MVLGNQLSRGGTCSHGPPRTWNRASGQWTVEVESKGSGLIAGSMQELPRQSAHALVPCSPCFMGKPQ